MLLVRKYLSLDWFLRNVMIQTNKISRKKIKVFHNIKHNASVFINSQEFKKYQK